MKGDLRDGVKALGRAVFELRDNLNWIALNADGSIVVFAEKPRRCADGWDSDGVAEVLFWIPSRFDADGAWRDICFNRQQCGATE